MAHNPAHDLFSIGHFHQSVLISKSFGLQPVTMKDLLIDYSMPSLSHNGIRTHNQETLISTTQFRSILVASYKRHGDMEDIFFLTPGLHGENEQWWQMLFQDSWLFKAFGSNRAKKCQGFKSHKTPSVCIGISKEDVFGRHGVRVNIFVLKDGPLTAHSVGAWHCLTLNSNNQPLDDKYIILVHNLHDWRRANEKDTVEAAFIVPMVE